MSFCSHIHLAGLDPPHPGLLSLLGFQRKCNPSSSGRFLPGEKTKALIITPGEGGMGLCLHCENMPALLTVNPPPQAGYRICGKSAANK